MKRQTEGEKFGYALIFLAGALWGTIGIFVKEMSLGGSSALMISFLRVAFAFFVMFLFTILKKGIHAFAIGKRAILFSALLGIVCHGIYNIFYSYAVVLSGVTVSAVLLNAAPIVTLLTSMICFSEKMNRWKLLALFLDIIGCTLAATGGNFSLHTISAAGIFCGVCAGICYAMTAILGRFAVSDAEPLAVSTYSYLFAALLLLFPAKPWTSGIGNQFGHILILGFLLALLPTAIAYVAYYKGLSFITEVSKVPIIASVETVVAALSGVLIYRETLNPVSITGIILVLLSIVFMNSQKTNRRFP